MNLRNHFAGLQTFIISTIAALVMIYPATAWSQKQVMATINGSDAYTGSGYRPIEGDEVRITISIVVSLSTNIERMKWNDIAGKTIEYSAEPERWLKSGAAPCRS